MDKNSLKVYNWNASLASDDSGNEEVMVSFRIKGINKPRSFVSVFQSAKVAIETVENGESLIDYMVPLTTLAFTVIKALKKSK